MSIGRAFYCDGPECETHTAPIATPPPYVPYSFVEVRQCHALGEGVQHFCGWECLMKYAAAQPVPEVVPMEPPVSE